MTLRETYELQQRLDVTRWDVSNAANAIWHKLAADHRAVDYAVCKEHPDVKAAQAVVDQLTSEVHAAQAAVGGRVYRVADIKLDALSDRIAKLNKRATKLGVDQIVLSISEERDQITRTAILDHDSYSAIGAFEGINCRKEIVDFTFVTVDGSAPMIPGFVFVATLDHETGSEQVGIRRVPVSSFLRTKIGEEAADAIEALDLTEFGEAKAWCVHCNTVRRRNQTYLVWNIEEGELRQVGSDCLRDYTGANKPERIAQWAEYLEALDRDLGTRGGDDGFGDVEAGSGRQMISTLDFLATVSAVTAKCGWVSRWTHGDYHRNEHATADRSMNELLSARKDRITPEQEDYAAAEAALTWVRDELAEVEEPDEFQHNLVTYTAGDYLPAKGDGFVAYAIEAHKRELAHRLDVERAGSSEWFGEEKKRLEITFTVTFTKVMEDRGYGSSLLTKGYTDEGNAFLWFSSGQWLEQGKRYTARATVKRHEMDTYNGGGKVTVLTRVGQIKELDDAAVSH